MNQSKLKPRPGPYRPRRRGVRIVDRETEALIRKLASVTGDSIEIAVLKAVKERHAELDLLLRRRIEWSKKYRPRKPRPLSA